LPSISWEKGATVFAELRGRKRKKGRRDRGAEGTEKEKEEETKSVKPGHGRQTFMFTDIVDSKKKKGD